MAPHEPYDLLIDRLADEYAAAIVGDPRQAILTACRVAWSGTEGSRGGGHIPTLRARLADASSQALARIRFPNDAEARAHALRIGANRPGGASVSATAIAQRSSAYGDVLAGGLIPTVENVSAAFALASMGGSRGARDEVQRRVAAGEDFVVVTRELASRLAQAKRGQGGPTVVLPTQTFDLLDELQTASQELELMDDHHLGRLEMRVKVLQRSIDLEIERRRDLDESPMS